MALVVPPPQVRVASQVHAAQPSVNAAGTLPENARLFALLNISFADSVIAFYDAKYTYNRWRPVTAIRAAGTDDDPNTTPDANWLPEVGNTTPDPAYPGAHAVISARHRRTKKRRTTKSASIDATRTPKYQQWRHLCELL